MKLAFEFILVGIDCDKSHAEKRFQNVQSRVKRVVATRVTCKLPQINEVIETSISDSC